MDAALEGAQGPSPSAWVTRFARSIAPSGRVLDVAAGGGRHARYLAALGFDVLAVDRDPVLLSQCSGARTQVVDLEAQPWPFAGELFAGVVVTHYLHRPLFPALRAALAPEGVLIYETFAVGQERLGRPARPEFLLAPGELLDHCRSLHVLAYEDGLIDAPRAMRVQRICAINTQTGASALQLPL